MINKKYSTSKKNPFIGNPNIRNIQIKNIKTFPRKRKIKKI